MAKIDAEPTKEFFINMLTRDIALDRALLDLIDNSVDAASASGGVRDKHIELEFAKESFEILDNCGGLSLDEAKKYAFRFGRDKHAPSTPRSVGQFGVGMKRTLFKLGRNFEVLSHHHDDCYKISVNVDEWITTNEWKFDFDNVVPAECPIGVGSTKIKVWNLYPDISEQFAIDVFKNGLEHEVSLAHYKAINDGLKVSINDAEVSNYELLMKSSNDLGYIKKQIVIKDVTVTITAGVSTRDYNTGGWYIVCNGRLVAEAEQTGLSGWGIDGIRKYHPDFAYFRGLVEFEADDSSKLPWTTTKTGVDKDNNIYRATLHHMKEAMREVISFLRERTNESSDHKKELVDSTPLNAALEQAQLVRVASLTFSESLKKPDEAERCSEPPNINVHYKVSTERLNSVKDSLGVSSATAVGKETFDYYYKYECE